MMMRSCGLFLAVALLAAAPVPPPGGGRTGGRVAGLAGTWTCRNPAGAISKLVYRVDGGGITGDETAPGSANAAQIRFTRDPDGGWRVERSSTSGRFIGHAPVWNTDTWIIAATDATGDEIRYERIDDQTLRRTFGTANGRVYAGDVCAKGDAPPDPALCAVADLPVMVVHAVEPDTPKAAMESRITGVVQVLVSLDGAGQVVNATIMQSPSPVLDAASLAAARGSTYRPALHNCKGVPGQYVFSVDYSA